MRSGQQKRLSNWAIGLILVIVVGVGSVLAYNKKLPWSHGYTVKAVFASAQNVTVKSPVRIAGVNVGTVTGVDPTPGEQSAVVTMEIKDEGRPIHEDATFKLRPRLFLEGNLFVEVQPGTPSSHEAPDGFEFPIMQTSNSVQLDQILTTLQSDVRGDLQSFLHEFGDSLIKYGGAKGFQEYFKTSAGANKNTALVNQALLGTEPHDLSGLIKNLDSTVRALNQNPSELQDLVTNLRIVTGSFAAHDESLQHAIAALPHVLRVGRPALANLNESLPPLRAFAREVLPGVKSTPPALDAATPFLKQVKALVQPDELQGLVHDLKPAVPDLVALSEASVPFLNESRALSSCFNEVVIPWSNDEVPDPDFPAVGTVAQETGYGLSGISGESRSGDANGQYIRVAAGGGVNTLVPLNTGFLVQSNPVSSAVPFFGFLSSQIIGARPAIESSAKTPFRPDVPCETNDAPNLDSGSVGAPPIQSPVSGLGPLAAPLQKLSDQAKSYIMGLAKSSVLRQQGKTSASNHALRAATNIWSGLTSNTFQSLINQLKALGTQNLKDGG